MTKNVVTNRGCSVAPHYVDAKRDEGTNGIAIWRQLDRPDHGINLSFSLLSVSTLLLLFFV